MNRIKFIYLKELKSLFVSPAAYIVGCIFWLYLGGWFYWTLQAFAHPPVPSGQPLQMIFGEILVFLLVILLPILGMRLIAEEQSLGTLEALSTAPVTWAEVILGKYFSVMTVYIFYLFPTLFFFILLSYMLPDSAAESSALGWQTICTTYLGLILVGGTFLAVSLFASCLTNSQVGAALIGIFILLFLCSSIFFEILPGYEGLREEGFFRYVDIFAHLRDFTQGILDTNRIAYHLSLTGVFLFLAHRILVVRFR